MNFWDRRVGIARARSAYLAGTLAAVVGVRKGRNLEGWLSAADRGIRTPASVHRSSESSHRVQGAEKHALPGAPR
jgi:hypothetical protein